ncbi:46223_t:CDS:1, partial [Gigaspora margarita]
PEIVLEEPVEKNQNIVTIDTFKELQQQVTQQNQTIKQLQ